VAFEITLNVRNLQGYRRSGDCRIRQQGWAEHRRNSDAKVPFTIKVLDTEEVNAFALPGGFFFVNSDLILKKESESELAGVMAHEIAHVACRHGTRQATKGELMEMGLIAGSIFTGYGWTGYAVRQLGGLAIRVLGPEHPSLAKTLSDLGEVYYVLGRYTEAEPLYRRALDTREGLWAGACRGWPYTEQTWGTPKS
jgi:hypothetical protein